MPVMTSADLVALAPLLVLTATTVLVLLLAAFRRSHALAAGTTVLGLVLALAALPLAWTVAPHGVTALLVVDGYGLFFGGLVCAAALAVTLLVYAYLDDLHGYREELYVLLLTATLGAAVLAVSRHFATLFVGLELLSLSLFALIAYPVRRRAPVEAAIKYLVLAGVSSALLAFGLALLYFDLGALGFAHAGALAGGAPTSPALAAGFALTLAGLAFKLSLVPFHFWTPDVYEGAPAPVVAFFSTAPKIAAVALLGHVLFVAFGPHLSSWQQILAIISAASMLVGAFGALVQNSIKRILAYSSISNVGFAIIGIAAGAEKGAASVLVYMTLYVIATLGMFGGVLALRRGGKAIDQVSDLNGLVKQKPGVALGLLILIFSVAGIPPAAGFWGKLQVFQSGLDAGMLWLVLTGALASVISLGYYLRLVWAMFMKPPGDALDRTDPSVAGIVFITSILMFPVLTITIQMLLDAAARAAGG